MQIFCDPTSELIIAAQIWKINNSLYDLLSLPPLIVPYIPYGIKIPNVEKSINQTTFQCLTPTGDGLNVTSYADETLNISKKGKTATQFEFQV